MYLVGRQLGWSRGAALALFFCEAYSLYTIAPHFLEKIAINLQSQRTIYPFAPALYYLYEIELSDQVKSDAYQCYYFISSHEVKSTAKSLQHRSRVLGRVYQVPISAYLDSNEIEIVQADDLTQSLQSRPCQRRRRYYYQLGCYFSLH